MRQVSGADPRRLIHNFVILNRAGLIAGQALVVMKLVGLDVEVDFVQLVDLVSAVAFGVVHNDYSVNDMAIFDLR